MYEEILRKSPFNLDREAIDWVLKTLSSLTLKEKIGQCFNLNCLRADEKYIKDLLATAPGGLHRTRQLNQEDFLAIAHRAAGKSKVPLIMSGDLETGLIHPFCDDLNFHSQLGVAATGKADHAARMGQANALIARSFGINWTFTPDVDLVVDFRNNATETRTYGDDPERVIAMASSLIENMQSSDLACTLKHWPGDGVDERDQHLVTTANTLSMEKWRESYGRIYGELIARGIKAVMTCHIALPAYDGKHIPASMNRNLNQKLLREELGFNGLIISDSTYMGGLGSQGPRSFTIPRILESGCDMILFSESPLTDISYLTSLCQKGKLSRERVDEAALRVLALKASLNLHKITPEEVVLSAQPLSGKEIASLDENIRNCIKDSVTLVKDSQKLLPINPAEKRRILLFQTPDVPSYKNEEGNFKEVLESKGFEVTEATAQTYVDQDLYDLIIYCLNQFEYFGSGSRRINWPALHGSIPKGLKRYWDILPTVMISLCNPFHLYETPLVKTYINAYSSNKKTLEILGDMLVGELPFKGVSPVDAFCGLNEARV